MSAIHRVDHDEAGGCTSTRIHCGGPTLVGFKALDLFASFGILSAGDPASETSTPEFLKDPATNARVDYLLVGLGPHEEEPTNRSVAFHRILEKYGIRHDYAVGANGAHDWATWRWLLHERLLPNLFKER